jgi:hypothetical protein
LAPAGGQVDYTLTCDAGAYVYTGQAATFRFARNLALAAGSYTYTGQAATLQYGHTLALAAGAYTYTGQALVVELARKLPLAAGAYVYTGQAITMALARNLSLAAGAYAYAGNDATLTYIPGAGTVNYVLDLAAGSYAYAGNDAILAYVPGSVAPAVSYGWVDYSKRKKRVRKPEIADPVVIEAEEKLEASAKFSNELQVRSRRKFENELRRIIETEQAETRISQGLPKTIADNNLKTAVRRAAESKVRAELSFVQELALAKELMDDAELQFNAALEDVRKTRAESDMAVNHAIADFQIRNMLNMIENDAAAYNALIDEEDEEVLVLL